ncbi:hypothetical protein V5T82_04605 [Magnetovibrio sp. PR-2]|uniref:hypothetical protein n=1 Tax=Magnetovibrio sp. PR-2 TaxID=3120356 RepID=UPI002FCE2DC4
MTLDDQQRKENSKELGRFGGLVVAYFAAVYLAIYANITYTPAVPWFLLVLIVGGFYIVPRAKTVMSLFNDQD